jgi:ribosomal protein L15
MMMMQMMMTKDGLRMKSSVRSVWGFGNRRGLAGNEGGRGGVGFERGLVD